MEQKYGQIPDDESKFLSDYRKEINTPELQDSSKPDQVVKELEYFRKLAKKKFTTGMGGQAESWLTQTESNIEVEAVSNWYKHQLVEKQKEIDLFNLNEGIKDAAIEKLTQEIESLKNKCTNYWPDPRYTNNTCINCGKSNLYH